MYIIAVVKNVSQCFFLSNHHDNVIHFLLENILSLLKIVELKNVILIIELKNILIIELKNV